MPMTFRGVGRKRPIALMSIYVSSRVLSKKNFGKKDRSINIREIGDCIILAAWKFEIENINYQRSTVIGIFDRPGNYFGAMSLVDYSGHYGPRSWNKSFPLNPGRRNCIFGHFWLARNQKWRMLLFWLLEVVETFPIGQNVRNSHINLKVMKQLLEANASILRKSQKTNFHVVIDQKSFFVIIIKLPINWCT